MNELRRVGWCLLLLVIAGISSAHAEGLRLMVSQSSAGSEAPASALSNIEAMTVTLTMDRKTFESTLKDASRDQWYEVTAFDNLHKPVQTRQWYLGLGGDEDHVSLHLLVEIPIDRAERRQQLSEFVDAAIAEEANPTLRDELKSKREAAITALERFFLQNRVGEFLIRVTLCEPAPPGSEAEARVRIVDEGTFVDKLRRLENRRR